LFNIWHLPVTLTLSWHINHMGSAHPLIEVNVSFKFEGNPSISKGVIERTRIGDGRINRPTDRLTDWRTGQSESSIAPPHTFCGGGIIMNSKECVYHNSTLCYARTDKLMINPLTIKWTECWSKNCGEKSFVCYSSLKILLNINPLCVTQINLQLIPYKKTKLSSKHFGKKVLFVKSYLQILLNINPLNVM